AAVRREHRRVLAGETGDDLVFAVAVEVRQLDVVAAAAAVHGRDAGGRLAGEEALAVAEEHPGLAGAGEGHQIELAVTVEVAVGERGDLRPPFLYGQRAAG